MLRRQAWVLASVLLGVAALAGCGTFISDTTFINAPPRPMVARSPRSVRIFSAARPQRPFVDVATLAVKQTHQLNEEDDRLMVQELRKRAAEMGCDGLVLGGSSEYRGAGSDSLLDPPATIMRATCIVYVEDAQARTSTTTSVGFASAPSASVGGSSPSTVQTGQPGN